MSTTVTKMIATFFGAGLLKPAPGTWGSLAALPAFWILHVIGGFPLVVIATIAVYFIGVWATKRETSGKDNHDPSEIVIDEVAGQWIALWPLSFGAAHVEADILALYPGWIVGFALFRLFDITKWGPIGWADKRNDATGVMLDDVIAGIFAAIGVIILAVLYHVVILA